MSNNLYGTRYRYLRQTGTYKYQPDDRIGGWWDGWSGGCRTFSPAGGKKELEVKGGPDGEKALFDFL